MLVSVAAPGPGPEEASVRLLGVSAGRVVPQTIDGERVLTAHVKTPLDPPWHITPTGVAGDEVAVHTDHLYVFDRAGYDHWAGELGVDRATWPDGTFAENLTVDSLDQTRLRVGDRFALGTAEVVVTGPRVPCWKLTWRLGQPKAFMRRFRLSGRSGAYFGVLRPGVTHPGDALLPLGGEDGGTAGAPGPAPTVAELSRLCDSGTRVSAAELATIHRALASRHLSGTARGTLELKLAGLAGEPGGAEPWRGWRDVDLVEVARETDDVWSFALRPTDGGPLPGFHAGQHVVVRLTPPAGPAVVRTWSLSEHAAAPTRYRITVRLRDDGAGSAALRALAAGQAVRTELRAPAGRFVLDRGTFRPVVLVGTGVGITPLLAMAQAHLARTAPPPLWVLHGVPDRARAPFAAHLESLAAAHEHVHVHRFESQPDRDGVDGGRPVPHVVHRGRLDPARLLDVLRGNYLPTPDGPAAVPWFESDVYLCGAPEVTAALRDGLVAAGANPDLVRVEDFEAAATLPEGPRRTDDAVVRFVGGAGGAGGPADPARHEEPVPWCAAQELTLLELAESVALAPPYDCRSGTCRTCTAELVDGDVDGPVTTAADGTRRVLPCVSRPLTDHVAVVLPSP